jgi:hypothetical protein
MGQREKVRARKLKKQKDAKFKGNKSNTQGGHSTFSIPKGQVNASVKPFVNMTTKSNNSNAPSTKSNKADGGKSIVALGFLCFLSFPLRNHPARRSLFISSPFKFNNV